MTSAVLALAAALALQSPAPVAKARTCAEEAGPARAERMARACRQLSPATRPPCNVANRCALVLDEILRSCAMWRPGEFPPKPMLCADYESPVGK